MTGTPSEPITVAAFDFDETLTTRDTVVPFLRQLASRRRLGAGLATRSVRTFQALARRDRHLLRSVVTEVVFAGRPITEVEQLATPYGRTIAETWLRDDTVARLAWHREQGHRTVIVSASYEQYVHVVAEHLGVDGVVATRLDVVDGQCTGRLDGPNCRGAEKVRRLREWFDGQGLDREHLSLWAYGDSSGDRELLAWADHPVWVTEPLASVSP
ncbi:MAG: HAD-IB family hydrolase [Ilumatobacteraceae bacterium]